LRRESGFFCQISAFSDSLSVLFAFIFGHYVLRPFVFIHIAGSTWIFNIFWVALIPDP